MTLDEYEKLSRLARYVSYDVDILSSDASARELAMQKVASHLKTAHKHALTDVPT
jgi:hypothetical protein